MRGPFRETGSRAMAADALMTEPTYQSTLGITVDARPAQVWPWLLQMGYHRGGLYSYDWLDRLFGFLDRPSATTILSEYQHLAPGDEIPMGRGKGFPVISVDPQRSLVLGNTTGGVRWVWELGLFPAVDGQTRLVSRNRAQVPRTIGWRLVQLVLAPAAFIMTRRMLLGIGRRAEALARRQQRAIGQDHGAVGVSPRS